MTIRMAKRSDATALTRLLQRAYYTHLHADWHLPADWLDTPGFLVREHEGQLISCFAVGADPKPAAWVRVVAMPYSGDPLGEMQNFAAELEPILVREDIRQLAWLMTQDWPQSWLQKLGFGQGPSNWVETYVKSGLKAPSVVADERLLIRPVQPEDYPALAAIEAAAFEPIWRHSASGLSMAKLQALTFTVAQLDDTPVGFQYSTRSQEGAHLVRLTVSPDYQGFGIGSALLADAFEQYGRLGFDMVSLNTQVDNIASRRLYQKFGFQSAGFRLPVWTKSVAP